MDIPKCSKEEVNRIDNEINDVFDEDGKLQPWALNKLLSILSTVKPSSDEEDSGKEDNSVRETEMVQKASSSSEMEKKHKASTPTPSEEQNGDNQKRFQEGDGGFDTNSEMEMEISGKETEKVHSELRTVGNMRKEMLRKLLHIAARKGNHIINDSNFLDLCYDVTMLSNQEDTIDRAKALSKHVNFIEDELNGENAGTLQGEGCPKESDKDYGPMDFAPADTTLLSTSKGETTSQGPSYNVPCVMNGHKNITRWTKGSIDDGTQIPQNVEKGVQIFQNVLEATQHVSQVIKNGGKSSPLLELGQTYLVDKAKKPDHVISNEKINSHSETFQQSTSKQIYGKNVNVSTVDEEGKEKCTSRMEQDKSTFADVLKYGNISKNFPLSSMFTDGKENSELSVSHTHQQRQVFSHSFHVIDDSSLFKVEPEVLEKRLNICKFSIVGKLSLGKGERPWTQKNLKEKLEGIWGLKSTWKLISLGRGFFHILLNSQDEWNKVWSRGHLHLKPGVMRLQRWNIAFDPWTEKSPYAQVWLRIYHLPWALWDPSVIVGIARKVGEPLKFDNVTIDGEFGHYARILVDVDLSKPIKSSVHIECGKFIFEVKLVPENLPAFCRGCFSIGHDTKECWNIFKRKDIAALPKNIQGEKRVINSVVAEGTLEELLERKPIGEERKPMGKGNHQVTEWRRKKTNGKGNAHKDSDNGIVESITDFGAQTGTHCSYDAFSGSVAVYNQFEALQTEDDFEKRKKEDHNSNRHVDDKVLPKRWSDILDEEEEKEDTKFLDSELPVNTTPIPLHPDRDKKPQEERTRGRDISEIRQGLQEMSQEYAHLLHMPTSSKKKKKLKS